MKLLINLCSHDGIVSHYNGVGTMTRRYIISIINALSSLHIDYHVNLFTPRYNANSFGYSKEVYNCHKSLKNTQIIMVENGSNGNINYGTVNNYIELCKNTANIINSLDLNLYDKVITIYNDTPFAGLGKYLNKNSNHYKVMILHSTVKIHKIDSALKNSHIFYDSRLKWEQEAIDFINDDDNSYYGVIGDFISKHLKEEYGLLHKKELKIYNGELLNYPILRNYSAKDKKLFEKIKNEKSIILAFSRAELYKNLEITFKLGNLLGITPVVIAQPYSKNQEILNVYLDYQNKYGGYLFTDAPFDFAHYILENYDKNMICLVPSNREIMGLEINEVRKLNRRNILIVSNNIDGLKEQINDERDGVLIDLNSEKLDINKIKRNFNEKCIDFYRKNSLVKLKKYYDIEENIKKLLFYFMEV